MQYTIVRTAGSPGWSAVPALSLGNILWEPDCGIRAGGQLCHDSENLYVRLSAREENIRAEYTSPLSPVWEDSCLEFFFLPEGEDRYFNFEINPNGCLWTGFGRSRQDRAVLVREDAKTLFSICTEKTKEGWEASFRIPLAFLRLFVPGAAFTGAWRANVYKCGDKTPHPHYLSWNPVTSAVPDFHRPQDFGTLFFQ